MRMFAITTTLVLAAACSAQVDPAATRILQDSAEAARKLTSLSYTMDFKGELAGLSQKARTDVLMLRDAGDAGRWWKRWLGSHEMVGMEPTPIEISDQGETITWIDRKEKAWHKEPARYVDKRRLESLVYAWFPDVASDAPYSDYLKAPSLAVLDAAEVGGVACDVVLADMGPNQAQRKWSIGKEDHLPRRLEWIFTGGISGSWVWEAQDLRVNPTVTKDRFDLPVPEGFERFEPKIENAKSPGGDGGEATASGGGMRRDSTGGANAARVPGTEVGNLAPDFELPLVTFDATGPGVLPVKGKSFKLQEHRGNVVVLDFFGSWNAQCRAAGPEIQKALATFRGRPVRWFSLAVRERDDAKPIEHMTQNSYSWGLLLKADDVAKVYKARVIPTYIVIGFEGEVVQVAPGFDRNSTIPQIQQVITSYLGAHQPATSTPTGGGDTTDGSSGIKK
jgi:thiol-disulfide isomerase/thioredoxin/outer membrane lipoprotein-sorting protein